MSHRRDRARLERAARRRFDGRSRTYDTRRWFAFNRRAQNTALSLLAVGRGDRLLDVGCGTGRAVRRAGASAASAIGLDLSEGMIRQARATAGGGFSCSYVVGSSQELPFRSGRFDAVLCTTSLHHYSDPLRALAEMARVLSDGGRIAIGDGCADALSVRTIDRLLRLVDRSQASFRSSLSLLELLREVGFEEIQLHWIVRRRYLIICARKGPKAPS